MKKKGKILSLGFWAFDPYLASCIEAILGSIHFIKATFLEGHLLNTLWSTRQYQAFLVLGKRKNHGSWANLDIPPSGEESSFCLLKTWQKEKTFPLPLDVASFKTELFRWVRLRHTLWQGVALCENTLLLPDEERIILRPKEALALEHLMTREKSSKADLLQEIWGYDEGIDTHTLESHLWSLRQNLQDTSFPGEIFWQEGYYSLRLKEESPSP